jgi:16S rRNA C1402 (ribose-2'-O) methylase RsmI
LAKLSLYISQVPLGNTAHFTARAISTLTQSQDVANFIKRDARDLA